MTVPLVRWARTPQIISETWRRSPSYREFRRRCAGAPTFAALVEVLEHLDGPDLRTAAALDFAPRADWARKFLNSLAAYRQRPPTDPQRALADRAVRVLTGLLTGAPRPAGRHPNVPLTEADVADIRRVHGLWTRLIRVRCASRLELEQAIDHAKEWRAVDPRETSERRRRWLNLLYRPPVARPSVIAVQMTAWQVGLPLRRVRAALRCQPARDVLSG